MNEKNQKIFNKLLKMPEVKKISIKVDKNTLKNLTTLKYNEQRIYRDFRIKQEPNSSFWIQNLKNLKKSNIERRIAFELFRNEFKKKFPKLSLIRLNWRADYFWKNKNEITALTHKKYDRKISCLIWTKAKNQQQYNRY